MTIKLYDIINADTNERVITTLEKEYAEMQIAYLNLGLPNRPYIMVEADRKIKEMNKNHLTKVPK